MALRYFQPKAVGGFAQYAATCVRSYGSFYNGSVNNFDGSVRPALWVNLESSNLKSKTDTEVICKDFKI